MPIPRDPSEFNALAEKLAKEQGVSVQEAGDSLLRMMGEQQRPKTFRESFKEGVRTVTQPAITALQTAEANRSGQHTWLASGLNKVAQHVLGGFDTPEGVALTAAPIAGPVARATIGKAGPAVANVINKLDPFAGGMPKMLLAPPAIGAGTAAATGGGFDDIIGGGVSGAVQGLFSAGTRGGQKVLFPESVDMGNRLVKGAITDVPELMPAFTKAPTIGVMLQRAPERIQGELSRRYQTMIDDVVATAPQSSSAVQFPTLAQYRGRVVDPTVGQPRIVTRTTLSDSDKQITTTKLGPNTKRVQVSGSGSSMSETQPPPPKALDLEFDLREALNLYQKIGRTARQGQVEVTVAPGEKQLVDAGALKESVRGEITQYLQGLGRPDLAQRFTDELALYARGIKVHDLFFDARKKFLFSGTNKDFGGAKPRELQEFLNFEGPAHGVTAEDYPSLYKEVLRGAFPGASAPNPRDPYVSVPMGGGMGARAGIGLRRNAPPVGQHHSSVPPRVAAVPAIPVADYLRSVLLTNPAAGAE